MTDKKTINRYKEYLKANLSKKRYNHSLNVAEAAVELAKLYGEDTDKALVAGLLHDVAKELPSEKQREYVLKSDLNVDEVETKSHALFHAIAGAEITRLVFGIEDMDIILAIRYHTVASGDMSRLAAIVYLADLISADRDYKDVKRMRKLSGTGLEKAMLEALKFSITDSVSKGNSIPLSTLSAYNRFLNEANKKDKSSKGAN
ncbi:MAG: bis(5'-nucleosyl)-tetraphosphatase (symmetrical) YqeK [Ruminococcus sp.]|nr:bis(5'-nucleosyl)-tetraphosphatase (symmetrical) YqeK [Ruminococcus sp.]